MALRGTIDAGSVPINIVISVYLISDLIHEISRKKLIIYNGRILKVLEKETVRRKARYIHEGFKDRREQVKHDLKKKK